MYHIEEELVYMGVDIAKAYLDAAIGNEKRRFANDALGHRELIKWVKQLSAAVRVICESSGGTNALWSRRLRERESKSVWFKPTGTAICASGWNFGQDRSNRCRGAVRIW